jgi:hypothetical protein
VEFDYSNTTGVVSYDIGALSPDSTYYFKVRGGNGCMPGNWSNELKATTPQSSTLQRIFYEYSPLINTIQLKS